jgi:hypothetical protein
MPLKYSEGDIFPSAGVATDTGKEITIEEVADGRPLILTFFRGPW